MVILFELWWVCAVRTNHRKTSPFENLILVIYAFIVHKFPCRSNCIYLLDSILISWSVMREIYHRPTYLWCFQQRFAIPFIVLFALQLLEPLSYFLFFFFWDSIDFIPLGQHTLKLTRLWENELLFVPINIAQDCRLSLLAFNRCSVKSPKCFPYPKRIFFRSLSFAFHSHK